jgi:hypothetical protein
MIAAHLQKSARVTLKSTCLVTAEEQAGAALQHHRHTSAKTWRMAAAKRPSGGFCSAQVSGTVATPTRTYPSTSRAAAADE